MHLPLELHPMVQHPATAMQDLLLAHCLARTHRRPPVVETTAAPLRPLQEHHIAVPEVQITDHRLRPTTAQVAAAPPQPRRRQ